MSSLKSLRSTVDIQRSVISELQHTVENLSTALTALEASMASFVKNEKEKEKDKEKDIQFPELSVTAQLNQPISSSPSKSKTEDGRKFNLVLHGIPELPSGTRYYDRLEKDHEEVVSLFESADVSLPPSSIRECLRLGKFNPDNQRPRPILIKFNSIRDAHQVTLVKSKLVSSAGSPVYVKRDLSKSERFLESILLKERRRLIDEGVARKHIRIQGVKLYVNSKLIGHAHPSGFCSYPSLGDHVPSLLNISNSTVCPLHLLLNVLLTPPSLMLLALPSHKGIDYMI